VWCKRVDLRNAFMSLDRLCDLRFESCRTGKKMC
jgi:hypothetical protein